MLKFSGSSCLIGGPNESGVRIPAEICWSAGRKQPACPAHVFVSRESPPKRAPSTTLCGRAREASFTRLGALGAWETPEHSESAPPLAGPSFARSLEREREKERTGGGRGREWCQQTLRQACSQEYPGSARCVQSFDDSLDSASRKTYRISLRSSSLWEPRHPSLKVLQR